MFSKIRLSGRGIVIHDGCILLNRFKNGGYYNIPGGGVETGETAKEAAKREVFEETGLEVSVIKLLFFFDYEPIRNNCSHGAVPHMSAVFGCELIGDSQLGQGDIPDIDPMDPENIGQAEWVKIEDIPNIKLVPEINEILFRIVEMGTNEPTYLEL